MPPLPATPSHGRRLTGKPPPPHNGAGYRAMPTVQGVLRADRRTKDLALRLKPGDVALINHPDLDATAARALVDCRVAAVVNAASSITGRYPNRGPSVLIEAGIPILDA